MDSDHPGPIGIDGVYVSVPRRIGAVRGEAVVSAIAKAPVHGDLALSSINLEGDDQADRTVHGGPDKAVYAYPGVHYRAWSAEGADLAALRFGENITCAGVTEADVRIGERWRWGDAELQVSQPRSPCYKLGIHTARSAILRRLVETGRCGWYLRVLTPGRVQASGSITVLDRPPTAPTVAETFAAAFPTAPGHREADAERVLAAPALAEQWRHAVLRRASRATS